MDALRIRFADLIRYATPRRYVVGRAELVGHGFTTSQVDEWIRNGRLVRVAHGVYSLGRDIETREAAWRAALLAAGPGAVLSGRSACEAWGIVKSSPSIPRRIEVAVPAVDARRFHGTSPALRATRIEVTKRSFEPSEIRHREGLAVTSVARALIDLAVKAREVEVRFAFLEACRLGLFDRRDVAHCFRRIHGRRGAKKLRPLLSLWVPELREIRSGLEGSFLLAWVDSGRPAPRINARVAGYEVDCHWPEAGVVLELDGASFHSDPLAKRRDLAKTRALKEAGMKVLRATYREVMEDQAKTVARVAAEIEKVRDIP